MSDHSPVPPKSYMAEDHTHLNEDEMELTAADIVAEEIEAGFDVQANASTQPMAHDPASSRSLGTRSFLPDA